MSGSLLILRAIGVVLCVSQAASSPEEIAARNAAQATEALVKSNRAMHAWLARRDSVTGLLPNTGKDPNWVVRNSAADLYPFMVLAAYYTEPALFDGAMKEILEREKKLSMRVDSLSDDVLPGVGGFVNPEIDLDRIIFGSSEYAKDGLLPLTEVLGESPWYDRLTSIATDIVRRAPYQCSRGGIPAQTSEVNGNMLQVLSRLYWKTRDEAYLNQAIAIADLYFLDMLPVTNYLPADQWDLKEKRALKSVFLLSDHGNEIVGGLSEICFLLHHLRPEKEKEYREPFVKMIDRLLEIGRNPDGVWVAQVDVMTGQVIDPKHAHCWGYMFNAVYTAYLITGEERFKAAVENAIKGVTQHPNYLFDETGAGRKWGANAYSDSIEGALVLLNRVPSPDMEPVLDDAVQHFLKRQREDGIIEDWYGDGNFIRTALMYALWKTQGANVTPWDEQVRIGAARDGNALILHIFAEKPWSGRIRFDHPRHKDHWNMAQNYPRLNEYPEWYTVIAQGKYVVTVGSQASRSVTGAELIDGLPVELKQGEPLTVRIKAS